MALRHKLLNLQTGRIMYKQPEYTFVNIIHDFFFSTVAIYYLGSHGCYPYHHDVCCHFCCHGDGCHSCRSGGDSCPGCGRVAADVRNLVHLRSADFYHRCSPGMADADTGRYCVALSHLRQNFHLQATASAEAWRSCHSTAQAAACGAATSCCSSADEEKPVSWFTKAKKEACFYCC